MAKHAKPVRLELTCEQCFRYIGFSFVATEAEAEQAYTNKRTGHNCPVRGGAP